MTSEQKLEAEANGEPFFELLRFNPRRASRKVGAAELRVFDGANEVILWMTARDIESNIKEFGPHPGLLEARRAYRDQKEIGR